PAHSDIELFRNRHASSISTVKQVAKNYLRRAGEVTIICSWFRDCRTGAPGSREKKDVGKPEGRCSDRVRCRRVRRTAVCSQCTNRRSQILRFQQEGLLAASAGRLVHGRRDGGAEGHPCP